MKRTSRWAAMAGLVVLASFALLLAGCATQQGAAQYGADRGIAGTWRGGSCYAPGGDPYKDLGVRYLLSLVPIGGGHFNATWEGSYVLPQGYARMTRYSGEFTRLPDGGYDVSGMAYFNTSAVFPPDKLPQVWVIHGKAILRADGMLQVTYDGFEVHDWSSEPFVDPPLAKPVPTPIVEVYKRFEIGGN